MKIQSEKEECYIVKDYLQEEFIRCLSRTKEKGTGHSNNDQFDSQWERDRLRKPGCVNPTLAKERIISSYRPYCDMNGGYIMNPGAHSST